MSTDGTREIASRFPKCWLVDNVAKGYDEGQRHRVVFEAARTLYPGEKKILLAIDADEMLSANWQISHEWQRICQLPPGSAIYAKWVNINPDLATWFPLGGAFIIGLVDDGEISYSPGQFHVPRLLCSPRAPSITLNEIHLLHLQYTDKKRSQSKNRAYQVQEWMVNPQRPIRLFRRFNSTLKLRRKDIHPIRSEWITGFNENGISWNDIRIDGIYRWDKLVLQAIIERGESFFRRLDIWDVDWNQFAKRSGVELGERIIRDPRSMLDKRIHRFLRRTQPFMYLSIVRTAQWALRCFGW